MGRMAARTWAGGKEKVWIQGKRMGARGDTLIKNQRNQRKGRLTARKTLRYKVASQSGNCPLLREDQGPDQEKKERLKDRRQEKGHVSTRLSSTHRARHHLYQLYLRYSCMQSLRTQRGGHLHLEGAEREELHLRHLFGKCIACYEIEQFLKSSIIPYLLQSMRRTRLSTSPCLALSEE